MAWQVSKFVWNSSPERGTFKLVLLALAEHADATVGECWPAVSTLARYCGLSERHVTRILSKLEETGSLERVQRQGRTSMFRIAGYTPDAHVTPTPDTGVTPTPDAHVTPPLTPASPTPDTGVTRTIKKQKKNPKETTKKRTVAARKRTDAPPLSREATDILQEWWQCTPDTHRPARCRDAERVIYAVKGWRAQAQALADRGITTRDVSAFVAYWLERRPDETLNFGNLANDILSWRSKNGHKSGSTFVWDM